MSPTGFVELETLLSDGRFIVDTTIPPEDSIAEFPDIDTAYHAPRSALRGILTAHSKRVQKRLSEHAGTQVEPIVTFESLARAQNLMNRSRHDHLAAIGCLMTSLASHAYTNTFVSTKTAAVIQFGAGGVSMVHAL